MQEKVKNHITKIMKESKKRKKVYAALSVCGLLVAFAVIWQLVMPGIAMTSEPVCGANEHTHSETCYTQDLTCGQAEAEGHVHNESCYTEQQSLTCALPEDENHTHSDECFTTESVLSCGQEESEGHTHNENCYQSVLNCGQDEHTHTDGCYVDSNADVETEDTWKSTFANVQLSGDWMTDVVAIARTQVGYSESTNNFVTAQDGSEKGYTRYGAWRGDTYGDWDIAFAAFCLNYAGVPADKFPINYDVNQMITSLQTAGYFGAATDQPQAGDLIFLQKADQETAVQVGIVSAVAEENGQIYIYVIEGNSDNQVKENKYPMGSSEILGYGLLSAAQEAYKNAQSGDAQLEGLQTENAENSENTEGNKPSALNLEPVEATGQRATNYTPGANDVNLADTSKASLEVDITQFPYHVGDPINGNISFDVNGGNIDPNTRVLYYKLPDGITFQNEMSGDMTQDGVVQAKYVITTDGYIIITLEQDFYDQNQTSLISGGVHFEATVSSYPEGGEFTFPGESMPVKITRDLSMKKVAGERNEDGSWPYTLTVSSKSGTEGGITVEDILSLSADTADGSTEGAQITRGQITITKSDGTSFDATEFPLQLSDLGPNESYTITYNVTVNDYGINADGLNIKNTATATSGSGTNTVTGSETTTTHVTDQKIQKTGEVVDLAHGEIEWTITINNPGGEDLSGKTVEDMLQTEGVTYIDGSFSITPAVSQEGNLVVDADLGGFEYTFPVNSTAKQYVIKYSTTAKRADGTVVNNASFEGGGDSGSVGTGGIIGWGLTKRHNDNLQDTEQDGFKKIGWTVSLTWPYADEVSSIEYSDVIRDATVGGKAVAGTHYSTVKELRDEIGSSLRLYSANGFRPVEVDLTKYDVEYIFYSDEGMTTVVTGDDDKVKSFKVKISSKNAEEPIDAVQAMFGYSTTIDTTKMESDDTWTIRNIGTFHDITRNPSYTYTPPTPVEPENLFRKERVNVWDWNSGGASTATDNNIDYNSTKELTYRIVVKTDNTKTFPYTVVDTLGEGMSLVTDENGNPDIKIVYYTNDSTYSLQAGNSYAADFVTWTRDDSGETEKWTFQIANWNANANTGWNGIAILYKVSIDDLSTWEDADVSSSTSSSTVYTHVYTNTVEWDGETRSTDTTATKTEIDFVKKSEITPTSGVKYQVTINAYGKDLDPNAETITLTDDLQLGWNPFSPPTDAFAYLNLGEVKLYYYDAETGEKGEEIAISRYNIGYDAAKYCMTITLPDELPCVLEYEYRLDAGIDQTIPMINTVMLSGSQVAYHQFQVQTSDGWIRARRLEVYKVDSENLSKRLSGAEFELYYYDTESNEFLEIEPDGSDTFTTDEEGILNLTNSLFKSLPMQTDKLLMLVETKAPEGYSLQESPIYFVIQQSLTVQDIYNDLDAHYKNYDWEIAGNTYRPIEESDISHVFNQYGGTMYIPNTSNRITIQKVWVDAEGHEMEYTPSNITVELKKKISNTNHVKVLVQGGTLGGNWHNKYFEHEYDIEKGTPLTIRVARNKYVEGDYVSTFTGGTCTRKDIDESTIEYTFVPTLSEGSVTIYCGNDGSAQSGGTVVEATEVDPDKTQVEKTETIELTEDASWYYETSAEPDATYSVEEVAIDGNPINPDTYTVSYYNNDGIAHGDIVITNKRQENDSYELPETGGMGTTGFTIGGALIMLGAALMYGYQLRRKRERGTV